MTRDLLLATQNAHKVIEIAHLLEPLGIRVRSLKEFPNHPELIEDGHTFVDNARKKAWTIANYAGVLTLADDSGLEVDALNGAPGVYSARYAPTPDGKTNDAANNRKLLAALENVAWDQRTARYQCVLVLADPVQKKDWVYSGACEGVILTEPRGEGGFGYDPLFYIPDLHCSMAQVPLDKKNTLSHRGKALEKFVQEFSCVF